jgi:2,3-bisphosphoglycerate-dependent phosphoglycerate mutase
MSNIYLIRHAQQVEDFIPTESQLHGAPLAQIGVTQAEHLRDRLAATREIEADILIASPQLRAKTTAEIIAPALGLPVVLDSDFQEFRIGNRAGIADKYMGEIFGIVDFEREPLRSIAPGGESWQQFTAHINSAFDRITRDYDGKTIVIVTHDGVICASFLYW